MKTGTAIGYGTVPMCVYLKTRQTHIFNRLTLVFMWYFRIIKSITCFISLHPQNKPGVSTIIFVLLSDVEIDME